MIRVEDVTIGTDTELFLIDRSTGEFKSAVGLIGGKKGKPIDIGKCCGLEEDGVSVEFTLPPVSLVNGLEEFQSNVAFILETIKKKIPEGLDVECCPTADFMPDQLRSRAAREAGCDIDFLAWEGGNVREKPNLKELSWRSAGGHCHLGYPDPSPLMSLEIVKYMDIFLTLPFVILDDDNRRRGIYGEAGSFRLKSYGVECRALSNFWTKSNELIEYVFNNTKLAIESLGDLDLDADKDDIVRAINTGNKALAENLCEKYNVPVLELV